MVGLTLRPNDDRGREILVKLDGVLVSSVVPVEVRDFPDQLESNRIYVLEDGTRLYAVEVDSLDKWLDQIDADWREHVTKLEP